MQHCAHVLHRSGTNLFFRRRLKNSRAVFSHGRHCLRKHTDPHGKAHGQSVPRLFPLSKTGLRLSGGLGTGAGGMSEAAKPCGNRRASPPRCQNGSSLSPRLSQACGGLPDGGRSNPALLSAVFSGLSRDSACSGDGITPSQNQTKSTQPPELDRKLRAFLRMVGVAGFEPAE